MSGVKEARGQVNAVNQFLRSESNSYSNIYISGWRNHPNFGWRQDGQQNMQQNPQNLQPQPQPQPYLTPQPYPTQPIAPMVPMPYSTQLAPQPVPQQAQYQSSHRRSKDNELRTKVTNLEQQLRKMNYLLENFIMA